MSETKVVTGGVPHAVEYMVTCDQTTVVGNGTTEDPLRVGPSARGIEVSDDGVPVSGGPFTRLNFEHATVTDAGSGEATVEIPRGVSLLDDGTPVADNPHNTLDFTGDGVTVTNVGGGRATIDIPGPGSAVFVWGVGQVTLTNGFIQPGGAAIAQVASDSVGIPIPTAGTLGNFFVRHNLGGTAGQTFSYHLLKNGSSTNINITGIFVGDPVTAFNSVQTLSVDAGDIISVQLEVTGSPGSNTVNAVLTLTLTPS